MSRLLRHTFAAAVVVLLTMTVADSASKQPAYSGVDWPAPGGDWGATRYSTLDQITTSTVSRLGGAWSIELPDRQASKAPIMVTGGRMFVVSSAGTIFALEPATGKTLWTFKPEMPFSGSRGVGIGDGMLFAGLRDSSVIAISQQTGDVVWRHQRDADIPAQGISSAAAYGNGVVVSVVSGGDNFARGRAFGLDAKTGARLWNFEVVPGPGEPGHETWPQDSDIWKYGGGALWTTPSVDADLGFVYLETGNAVPQWGGEIRAGTNLYDNSVVALELKTGKLRWHYQLVHHDIWEHDVSTPLVLYDADVGGRPRKLMAAMRTDGVMFYLDRETGKPVLPVEERPVKQNAFLKTSPTQPFTVGADRVGPECVDKNMIPPGFVAGCYFDPIAIDAPNHYMPHMNMRQTPMAYSPQTRYLYASVCINPAWIRRAESPWVFVRPTRLPGQQQYGLMAAVDSRTGKVAWQTRVPYAGCEGGSGATATAGGLVLHAEPDGDFQAYDAKSGKVVWHFQTGDVGLGGGAGPGGGSAVTYAVDGTQYVALAMNHRVWAFKLGGTVPQLPAPTPPPTSIPWEGRVAEAAADATIQLGTVQAYNVVTAGRRE
ncbi:MAG TPA: PQQ-binding-like beta-propeller repeat protein, partial [Vicinamibacterales bacterium]|nr:PQQ-binding-like beta-propeller repeat protein [Vicinamibacterales bacterium]